MNFSKMKIKIENMLEILLQNNYFKRNALILQIIKESLIIFYSLHVKFICPKKFKSTSNDHHPSGPYKLYRHEFNVFPFFSVCVSFSLRIKLLTPYSLAIYDVERRDKGMYQCLITNKDSSAQAVAELKLGGELK